LILGAGALQLVGLKTITVKNLALASRCLQLIVYHVTFVERQYKKYVIQATSTTTTTAPSILRHLSQVSTDFRDHISEINSKLISVIDYQLTTSIARWEFAGQVPSAAFQSIGKHMCRFYEGAATILPNDQMQNLMFRVHDNFKRALRTRLLEMDITPQKDMKTYTLVCSEFSYYMEVLRSIECCKTLTDTMNDVMSISI